MAEVLIDTNVFIDHLRGAVEVSPDRWSGAYSVITRVELFAGRKTPEPAIRKLLSLYQELVIDQGIAERAGRLRRDRRISVADAVIAATALEHKMTLLTRNLRDFQGVPGLKVRSPE